MFGKDKFRVRNANMSDIEDLLKLEEIAWAEGSRADKKTYISRLETFPEGIFIGEHNGNIEGAAVTEIIDSRLLENDFTWNSITDSGAIKGTHNPRGDAIYGVNLSVKPNGIGNRVIFAIMKAIAKMAIERNMRWGVLGGRLPGFSRYIRRKGINIETMTGAERDELAMRYINGTTGHGRSLDPEIAIYRKSGLKAVKPIRDYFPDPASLDYGVLLIWENPLYNHHLLRRIFGAFSFFDERQEF